MRRRIINFLDGIIKDKNNKKTEGLLKAMLGMAALNSVALSVAYIKSIYLLTPTVLYSNILVMTFAILLPIIAWILLTKYDWFNYRQRKRAGVYLCLANGILTLGQIVYNFVWVLAVRRIMLVQPTRTLTVEMIVNGARLVEVVILIFYVVAILINIHPFLDSRGLKKLEAWKLEHVYDMRNNKSNLYDLHIMNDLETGKDVPIKENDRFTHILVDGASGTGKTSSIFTPGIACDLNRKYFNKIAREKALFKMLYEKKAYIVGPKQRYTENDIKPKKKYIDEYNKIYETYRDCGMTIQAPNNSLNDDICRLALARGERVNVIDPSKLKPTFENETLLGINPFYVPLELSEEEMTIQILEKANIFSEVLNALNARQGNVDVYFASVNKQVTSNIAVVLMLDCWIRKQQADIIMVQKAINQWSLLTEPIKRIESYFGIDVKTDTIMSNKDRNRNPLLQQELLDNEMGDSAEGLKDFRNMDKEDLSDNLFYLPIYTIKQELLGAGQEQLFQQSRGLRNMINALLNDPRMRRVYNAEQNIDFDKILRNNEITVVNTALEMSEEISTTLGLFFMLNLKVAVQRRPKDTRSNHFYWIDEGPQYMHSSIEAMWALFRQYRVAIVFALQSLSQTEKTQSTAYLKQVFLTAGTHIVFGRVGIEEMKIYSEMGGLEEGDLVQKTVSQNSLLSENTGMSFSERVTKEKKNVIEGSDVRQGDFQEVTLLYIDNGRVMPGAKCKTNFINKKEFEKKPAQAINWSKVWGDLSPGQRVSPQKDRMYRNLTANNEGDTAENEKSIRDIIKNKQEMQNDSQGIQQEADEQGVATGVEDNTNAPISVDNSKTDRASAQQVKNKAARDVSDIAQSIGATRADGHTKPNPQFDDDKEKEETRQKEQDTASHGENVALATGNKTEMDSENKAESHREESMDTFHLQQQQESLKAQAEFTVYEKGSMCIDSNQENIFANIGELADL